MPDPADAILNLLCHDRRYHFDAYVFVFEALHYAHKVLGMGSEKPSEPVGGEPKEEAGKEEGSTAERHLTGQQLCAAIRQYALEQYGYMAKCVLDSWGVHTTGDFGEIVFNLIQAGQMRKTKEDRRADFDDVFDFETGLRQGFEIKPPP